ncbi:nitronate monooxygenase family protein [Mesotoga sp.]|uniref:NAD(P)H-dependent flavin oxidoreductase n=1 Tax=Mesotoga sp. TaxID=2053577 RepID=UPI002C68D915|nr:nitronate monooxygenase family protein [Mesotoga sp.]
MKNHETSLPLIQGGMAVGISLDNLAASVASEGGIGVIGTAGIGMTVDGYRKNFRQASIDGLKNTIRRAREKTKGVLGVNIMVALTNYAEMVATAVKEKIDVIVSGAGLPLDLPSYLEEGSETAIIPVVSSLKSATVIFKRWFGRYRYVPDGFVVEGPKAGGHLGYRVEEIFSEESSLEKTLPEIRKFVDRVKLDTGKNIPVIAAGGIFDRDDVERVFKLGASAVQVGTAFVATEECDADYRFKQAFVDARSEDVTIIKSPVGMPGRAIRNKFIEDVENGKRKPFKCAYQCIKTCNYKEAPYCIAEALLNACKGDLENGFAFCGSEVHRISGVTTVKKVIDRLFGERR